VPVEQGPIVCFDTMMLIWGVKRQAMEADKPLVDKTGRIIERLTEQKSRILVPTVALSELLVNCETGERVRLSALIEENFLVPPFDICGAHCAADLQKRMIDNKSSSDEQVAPGKREHVKADCMILATAITNGAIAIYSDDDHIASFAKMHNCADATRTIEVVNPRTLSEEKQGVLPDLEANRE